MTTLSYDILWRDRGATRGMQRLGHETEQAQRKYAAFGKVAAVAGLVVAAAAIKFGKDSVRAYTEAQTSQVKLQGAFAKFPALADTNINALRGLNTELAKKTRFDDDATASGQAVLAQFKLTGAQITQLTPLLQDYAAKTGKDLPSAATVLGKAVLGNGRALKAVGINFKDTGSEAGNFEQIVAGLRTQVGGFAQQEGKTAAGQIAILKNQFGELQEAVGSKLVPSLSKGVGLLTDFVGFIDKNKQVVGPLTASIAGIAGSISLVVVAAKGIRAVSAAFDTLSISAKGASLAAGGVGIALGIATLAIGHYAKKSAEAKQQTDSFTEALIASNGAIDGNVRSMAAKALSDKGAFDNAQKLGISLQDVTDAALGNEPAMQRVMAAVNHYAAAVDSADTKTQDQVDAANELADALLPVRNQFDNGKKAAGQFGQATGESTKKVKDSKKALDDWRISMFRAARAAIDLEGSQDAVEAAVDDATASVKSNGKTLDSNTEKGRSNRQALRNIASASIAYREKLIEQGASTKRVTNATNDARAEFIKTAVKMGATKKEAQELATKFGLLDRKIDSVDGQTVKIKFKSDTSWKDSSGVKWSVNLSAPSRVGGKAAGGPIKGPGTGTSDSVLKWLSTGEYVVNAKQTARHRPLLEDINAGRMAKGGYIDIDLQRAGLASAGRVPGHMMKIRDKYADEFGERIGKQMAKYITPAFSMGGLPGGGNPIGRGQAALIRYGRMLGMGASTYPGHHPSQSRARDFSPIGSGRGDAMAGHAWAHAKNYGVWYVIWNRRIASRTRASAGWRPYTRYGANASPSQAHTNHVHVAWYDKGGTLRPGWTMAYNGTGRNERVVPAGGRATTIVNNYTINATHYSDAQALQRELVNLNKQGRLAVTRR